MSIYTVFAMLGGLALFLYGMDLMSEGLETTAGNKLHSIIEKLTSSTSKGLLVGIVVTAIMQSSSATTVMTVGFVNAGLMTIRQSVGIIMGANIGTTVTGQLVALNITDSAPLLAFGGFIVYKFVNKKTISSLGSVIMGLGLLFMGMEIMSSSMSPLQDSPVFSSLMLKFSNPILGVLIGCLVTALIQSSSASMGILQALANKNLIGLSGSIYIICGFNIGTCVTSLLSSMGSSVNAKRTAMVHVLFNLIGTILFILMVQVLPIEQFILSISRDLPAAQLANLHTMFNVVTTMLLFPFSKQLASLATRLLPMKDAPMDSMSLRYIKPKNVHDANLVLTDVRAEADRMLDISLKNYYLAIECFYYYDENKHNEILHNEEVINYLNSHITKYIIDLLSEAMDDQTASYFTGYMRIVRDIERIGDHIKNIAEFAEINEERQLTFSDKCYEELDVLNKSLLSFYDLVTKEEDRDLRRSKSKELDLNISNYIDTYRELHLDRMKEGICNPESGLVYEKTLTAFERISAYLRNIGKLKM